MSNETLTCHMTNEKRLIDANALLEAIDKSDNDNFHRGVANRSIHHYEHMHFEKMVLDFPTVDAVEVVHGWWIYDINNLYGCSKCLHRETMSHKKKKNYCPNCGAKMDGDGNG